MKIRQGSAIAMVAAGAIVLAGCTGGGGGGEDSATDGDLTGEITFQTWSLRNDTFTPYFEDLIERFEDEHPGASIEWVDQPGDGYEDQVLQQAESGELPDVVNLPPEFAYSLAEAELLVDLEQESAAYGAYVEGGLEAYRYDEVDGPEGVYGFPWYLGTDLNYWNTDLLTVAGIDEPPADVDEFLDVAEQLGQAGTPVLSGLPGAASILSFTAEGDTPAPMFDGTEFVFDTPEAIDLVERYTELYAAGAVAPSALQGESSGNVNQFNTGAVAWTTAGPNYIAKDVSVNAPNLVDSVAVTGSYGVPPLFVQGISVSAQSEQPALALAFAEYVTNDENQVAFVQLASGFYPGTIAANDDPASWSESSGIPLQDEATEIAASQLDSAQALQPPVWTEAMNTYANQQIALAVTGDATAQEALEAAVQYANDQL